MKNDNSPCEDWRFFQNKVPNQFPEIVMKYAYGSGNLRLDVAHASGFVFVQTCSLTMTRVIKLGQIPKVRPVLIRQPLC